MNIVTEKKCTRCGKTKSIYEFSPRSRNLKDGHQASCKNCEAERSKAYKINNREKVLACSVRMYRARVEYYREYKRDYYLEHKSEFAFRTAKRKSIKSGNGGFHTLREWQDVLKIYNYKCLRCGTTERITKDHIFPISKGGTDDIDNVQPLCHSCNVWKGTKFIDFR